MKIFFKTSVASLFLLVLLPSFSQAAPPTPTMVNYQGILTNSGGDPIDGSVKMGFAIYDEETGETPPLWQEVQDVVVVVNGLYNVQLGEGTPLPSSGFTAPNAWLEVTVAEETLSPRQQITSVLYSLKTPTGVLSSFGYHTNDCDGIDEKFVHLATQEGVDYGLCMEKDHHTVATWGDASDTCKMAGKRLPDYVEWRKACDGETSGASGTVDPFYTLITDNHWEWASSRSSAAYYTVTVDGVETAKNGAASVVAGRWDCSSVGWGWVHRGGGYENLSNFRCVR